MNGSETRFFNRNGVIGTAATNNGVRQYTVLDTRNQACMSTTVASLALRVAHEWADRGQSASVGGAMLESNGSAY